MRILVADSERGELVSHSSVFTIYGSVDIAHTLLDAVILYANSCACGCVYDLVVIHQQSADVTDGDAVIEALRKHEAGFRKSGIRTMICHVSDNDTCQLTYENKNGKDDMINFQRSPVNIKALEDIARRFASITEMQKQLEVVRPGRSLSIKV